MLLNISSASSCFAVDETAARPKLDLEGSLSAYVKLCTAQIRVQKSAMAYVIMVVACVALCGYMLGGNEQRRLRLRRCTIDRRVAFGPRSTYSSPLADVKCCIQLIVISSRQALNRYYKPFVQARTILHVKLIQI